jgi:hypothetical protein
VNRLGAFGGLYVALVLGAVAMIAWLHSPPAGVLVAAENPASASGRIPAAIAGRGHSVHLASARGITCESCHELAPDKFTKPSAAKCQGCHEGRHVGLHKSEAAVAAGAAECTACHSFVPRAGDERDPWSCMRCHEDKQGAKAAIVVHAKEACGTCHRPHEDRATVPADCTTCHDGKRAPIHPLADARPCASCHEPHVKAPRGADACTGCHFEKEPKVPETAIFRGGHQCTGCHSSHEKGASVKTPCTSCHAQQHVVGMERVPQHSDCLSCHDNHNVMHAPGDRCVGCHATVHADRAVDVSRGCTSCHDVHGKKGQVLTTTGTNADCSTCHTIAASDRAFHDRAIACTGCHATHGSNPLGPKKIAPCATCHEKKADLVALNAGHADCKGCHTPHAPLPPKTTCSTCHAPEAQSAPRGHAVCTSCHEPHSGSRPACTSCHEDKKASVHGALDGGCQTCHRPHGPKPPATPPACTSCHAPASLPALHTVPQHGDCRTCHSKPHQLPAADRATCTSCHTDRKDHEKNATRCVGCHNFRGAK